MSGPTFDDLRHAAEEHEEDVEPAHERLLLGSALMALGKGELAELHVGYVCLSQMTTRATHGRGHELAEMRKRMVKDDGQDASHDSYVRERVMAIVASPYRLNPADPHLEILGTTVCTTYLMGDGGSLC